MKYLTASVAALGLMVTAAAPAYAQNVNANNLISVQISDPLLENILNDLNIEVEDSVDEITVQVPVGVAATVCDVSANVLAQQDDDAEPCNASTTSQALNQIVKRQFSS